MKKKNFFFYPKLKFIPLQRSGTIKEYFKPIQIEFPSKSQILPFYEMSLLFFPKGREHEKKKFFFNKI